ncbi:MAG TPA: hypothetical protein VK327_07460, partial [Candidatus Paceibacterota bacterium]|nr:hypothetical protein [Candidatus Paceibacterota bacterium]
MQIRFLLGPAGSGKTHRCLAEIREALHKDAAGSPLILLAPKQATFQLERQLLTSQRLPGYTRLHILSFERLAEFIFEKLGRPVPKLLAEEGRVMVLRALLEQKRGDLKLFRASARLPGFARQLSQLLRELQQYHLTPARLENLAGKVGSANRLNAKLEDLALILRAYADWLEAHKLQDADCFLDLATQALKARGMTTDSQMALSPHEERAGRELERGGFDPNTSSPQPSPPAALGREGETTTRRTQLPSPECVMTSGCALNLQLGGLWLDGFAQMTPQERQLLAAVTRCSPQTTLAFCLDEPKQSPPWHSLWAPVMETFQRCRDELGALPDASVDVELLPRNPAQSR